MSKCKNIAGRKFGEITAIDRAPNDKRGCARWNCICTCGTHYVVRSSHLLSGGVRSCGCKKGEYIAAKHFRHGMSGTKIYGTWQGMVKRCTDPTHISYPRYGGRGVDVCSRWMDFNEFYKDMGDPPSSQHSIDRIENDKGYFFDNCKWATPKEQSNNRRDNVMITHLGETLTKAQWAEKVDIKYHTLNSRLHSGWSINKALTTPVDN
jgi:hypothetical protein